MSVDETNKIDFTSLDKNGSHVLLTISDHLGWEEEEGEHLLLLQDKLNTYLYFIESGKLVETFSWADGLPVVISIVGKFPLSTEATRFFGLVKGKLEEIGVSLEFRLVSEGSSGARV
jgi:hypothetical protein